MITIITGTPGAGKTLYAISELLRPLVGTTIKHQDANGEQVELPRTIYTNINGLLLDHELIDGGDKGGLSDWHLWAKPGSVIVFDEFQKVWPPKPNGSAIPPEIQALDTHRHMGVDFILITQSVMNTHKHIHALGGRHLHVRRVANMKLAVVYEWDHVSRALQYPKAITKSPWRYDHKVFKLYRSAEVHTKQPRKIPGLVWFILLGLLTMAVLGPIAYSRLKARTSGEQLESSATKTPAQPTPKVGSSAVTQTAGSQPRPIDDTRDWLPRVYDKPETAPVYDHLRRVRDMPQIVGAMCINDSCTCYTQQQTKAQISPAACLRWSRDRTFDPYHEPASTRDAPAARGAQTAHLTTSNL